MEQIAPGAAQDILGNAIENLQSNQGAAGLLLIVSLGVALWSASGYVAAFMRASNDIWDVEEGRPIWITLPVRLLTTLVLLVMLAAVASPNVKHPKFRWVSPGGAVGVILWILASAGFAFYVANFASYNETYGALGGVIVFLIWLWITNIAVLLGAELDAELERDARWRAASRRARSRSSSRATRAR